jgi:hypothetical protein
MAIHTDKGIGHIVSKSRGTWTHCTDIIWNQRFCDCIRVIDRSEHGGIRIETTGTMRGRNILPHFLA